MVRDLAWVMGSPGLLHNGSYGGQVVSDAWCRSILESHVDHLQRLDADPLLLQTWLTEHHSHRLGAYFEALLGFWLKELLKAEIYHHNIAVFRDQTDSRGRQTIGEFDFLFRLTGEECPYHWEAAVKFYLRHCDSEGMIHWYGPAASDRLDIKLDRLFGHQLQLAATPEGAEVVDRLGVKAVKSQAFAKGYLFYPFENWRDSSPGEEFLSRDHLRGWWLDYGDLSNITASSVARWVLLRRHQWLAPAFFRANELPMLLDFSSLVDLCRDHFAQSDKALLFAEMTISGDAWTEANRGFVVGHQWPDSG